MEAQFVRTIDIKDNNYVTCFSFDLSKEGIYLLAAKYASIDERFHKQPTIENIDKIVGFTKIIKKILLNFDNDIKLLTDNDKEVRNFCEHIFEYSRKLDFLMLDLDQSSLQLISDSLYRAGFYTYSYGYRLVDSDDSKDFDYYNLTFNRLEPKKDNEMVEDDEDKWIDNYDYIEEFSYPIHKSLLNEIRKDISFINNQEKLIKFFLYWRVYKDYYQKLYSDGINSKEIKDVDNIVAIREKSVKKECNQYNYLYNLYSKYTDVMTTNNESKFNNIDVFISELLEKFVNRKDIYFFIDLKEMFKKYDRNDKESCMYLVKELSDILVAYKYTIELKCLKHLVSEENIIGGSSLLNIENYECLLRRNEI